MTESDVIRAIVDAHHESDCNDYYCGCWDSGSNDPEHRMFHAGNEPWPHTTRFLAALRARGYDVVRIEGRESDLAE